MTQPIFLVGPRGSGKTTIGQALAQALGLQFIDTDHWLLSTSGMSVAEIVEQEGWDGFRLRESQALKSATQPGAVVATGGGIVLRDENREFMREQGLVLYLRASVDTLTNRLEAFPDEGQRPTLTGKTITDEISEVLAAREALYQQSAHHFIDASQSPSEIVADILQRIPASGASKAAS
ncbi:shikimate kinase II [Mangrovibacter phragmitis]|uniref:Shikimate kinase 2 n=1 Tax=Mangrovibacter phragmitis TaxID=1691903 RepID=A0A1B7L162_9ENTR|nr:shikimate kinase AroL [Mangrovibacter phragmitis]OAT75988.1 shikimate kinase II [Mangrovibacter phragmitis]